ncbi:MAG: hypothetical protein M3393_09405 [Actinomycetota bacterium]|nr:hypothetical protein [Actinomycetota bacterium]
MRIDVLAVGAEAPVDLESIDAELGETYPVTLDWSGLELAPYLGWVGYSGSEQPTIVSIDGAGEDGGVRR